PHGEPLVGQLSRSWPFPRTFGRQRPKATFVTSDPLEGTYALPEGLAPHPVPPIGRRRRGDRANRWRPVPAAERREREQAPLVPRAPPRCQAGEGARSGVTFRKEAAAPEPAQPPSQGPRVPTGPICQGQNALVSRVVPHSGAKEDHLTCPSAK